jgi:twinkle protein
VALSEEIVEQLESRGLDEELAAKLQWDSQPPKRGGGDHALIIPFIREGKTVNRKFRTLGDPKKFWQDTAGVQCFWNEDCLRDDTLVDEALIITEGEIDAASAIRCGYLRCVSVPGGAPEKPLPEDTKKFDFIDQVRKLIAIDRVKEIILAVDNDAAGAVLMHELSIRLGRFRCKYLTYPKQPVGSLSKGLDGRLKDLNEVLIDYGADGVRETIKRARFLKIEGVARMSDLPPLPHVEKYDNGFPRLRDNFKMRLGDFMVATGIPSHGKTSFVNDLCCRAAENYGLITGFASFEQTPQRDHRRNLRVWKMRKPVEHADSHEVHVADQWIDKQFAFIVPSEDEDVTLDWLLDKMEAAVIQYGCKIIVVDPWNELDHQRRRDESITEYVGRAIKALKRFARRLQIFLIVVAHPTKQRKNEDGDYLCPTLYDISDSANWYNKCDVGVIVHRIGFDTMIRVQKTRYHDEIGEPGDQMATFHLPTRRFIIDEPDANPGPPAQSPPAQSSPS